MQPPLHLPSSSQTWIEVNIILNLPCALTSPRYALPIGFHYYMKDWLERTVFGLSRAHIVSGYLQSELQHINSLDKLIRKFSNCFIVQRHTPFSQVRLQVLPGFFKSFLVVYFQNPYLEGMKDAQATLIYFVTRGFCASTPSNRSRNTSYPKSRIGRRMYALLCLCNICHGTICTSPNLLILFSDSLETSLDALPRNIPLDERT